jgi:hypothetical protein
MCARVFVRKVTSFFLLKEEVTWLGVAVTPISISSVTQALNGTLWKTNASF